MLGGYPSSLFRHTDLIHLELDANLFTGVLLAGPRALSLTSLIVAATIPTEITKFANLKVFSFANNELRGEGFVLRSVEVAKHCREGTIPEHMTALSALERFSMALNRLVGERLGWGGSQFCHNPSSLPGTIPNSFSLLTALTQLSIGFNGLDGKELTMWLAQWIEHAGRYYS